MLPKGIRALLTFIANQFALQGYAYTNLQRYSKRSKEHAFLFEKEGAPAKWLLRPVDVNSADVTCLETALQSIEEDVKDPSTQFILPVRWSCEMESQAFNVCRNDPSKNEVTGVGLLVINSKKEARWAGVVPLKVSEQLSVALAQCGISLSAESSLEMSSTFQLSTQVIGAFSIDLRSIPENDRVPPSFGFLNMVRFWQSKDFQPSTELVNFPMELIQQTFSQCDLVDLSPEAFFSSEQGGISFQGDYPQTFVKTLKSLASVPSYENYSEEGIKEFCCDFFLIFLSSWLKNQDSSKTIDFNRQLPMVTAVICKVLDAMVHYVLPNSPRFQRIVRDCLSQIIKAVDQLSVLKLRFYGVYKQLVGFVKDFRENQDALNAISNYISLLFQKEVKVNLSSEELLSFLNECFFEWSDRIENYFSPKNAALQTDNPADSLRIFLENLINPYSNVSCLINFIVELLSRLPVELNGLNKSSQELFDTVSSLPLKQWTVAEIARGHDSHHVNHFVDVLPMSPISLELPAPTEEPVTPVVRLPADKFSSTVMPKPVSMSEDDSTSHDQEGRLLDASVGEEGDSLLNISLGLGPPITSDGTLPVTVFQQSIKVTADLKSVPQVIKDSPNSSTVIEKVDAPVAKLVPKKSIPWHRVVLGVIGLGLLSLGIAAAIVATHGVAAAALPWLAKAIVLPLIHYAGSSATATMASVAASAGVLGVVAAVPPEMHGKILHKFTGFCKSLWNKLTGKSNEKGLVAISIKPTGTATIIDQLRGDEVVRAVAQPNEGRPTRGPLYQQVVKQEEGRVVSVDFENCLTVSF